MPFLIGGLDVLVVVVREECLYFGDCYLRVFTYRELLTEAAVEMFGIL